MRYIHKVSSPDFFINETKGLSKWNDYTGSKKPLREYILKNEQNYLCIYCESKVSSGRKYSHIEHLRPKEKEKYPELTFKYKNLVVSCNGNQYNQAEDNNQYTCGHIKSNKYDENKFLNPIEIEDIRDYFKYDFDDFIIESSGKNDIKANYTITTLKLNDARLTKSREKSLKIFIIRMRKIRDIKKRKMKIIKMLNLGHNPHLCTRHFLYHSSRVIFYIFLDF
jgi:uncharacterized protein (TIGR02646 family)